MSERKDWHSYFMDIAVNVAERSTCTRRKVGAVITDNNILVSSGYNGAPHGMEHCTDKPSLCIRNAMGIPSGERLEICRAVHAEQNAIIQAKSLGRNMEGGTIYVTTFPCVTCAKLIIQSGIKNVVYIGEYNDPLSVKMLEEAHIGIQRIQKD